MKCYHFSCATVSVLLLPTVFLLGGLTSVAAAAEPATKSYRELLPLDEKQKSNRSKIVSMLRAGEFLAQQGGKEAFDDYYKKYALPRWTVFDNRSMLPNFRRDLAIELKSAKTEGGKANLVYAYVRDKLVLPYMANFAKPWAAPAQEFSPAVRVNAMLTIGELNETEPATTAEPPKPLAAALPILVATVKDANQLDAVKVAALDGLVRHAKLGGAWDQSVIAAMLELVNASKPPEGRTADGHAWMRGLAAEVLGELKWAGNNGDVAKALAKMVAESDSPFLARCAAARALGRLNYQGVAGLNPSDMARGLGGLAVDACKAESEQFSQFSKRRLKEHLTAVWFGLTGKEWGPDRSSVAGIAGLATAPPHQAFVAGVRKALENLLEPFDNTKLEDADVAAKARETCAALEKILKK